MVFPILIIFLLLAIAFFHYVQGLFSGTISAILSVLSAVIAVSYYESLVEGPLAGVATEWMPALMLLGLFAVPYVVLRTIFDKLVPGQVMLPAALDKAGGAVMGVVAGVFALGVVAIAAQAMPFGASVGGYARYEVAGQRSVIVPTQGSSSSGGLGRAKDAATFDEMVADRYETATKKGLWVPVDDILVGTVAHLSDTGSLSSDKPFTSIHPDLLQELFGQRLGAQVGTKRAIVNAPAKNRADVDVAGVFKAPPADKTAVQDAEFSRLRSGAPVKVPAPGGDEMRVVVRVRFNATAADTGDNLIRLSPGAVRLVAPRPDELNPNGDPQPHNHYPVGTMGFDESRNVTLYAHKIDDFLIVDPRPKKLDGSGDGTADVDFVFHVKKAGFLADGEDNADSPRIAPGVFVEVKRFGRVDLGEGNANVVKAQWSAPAAIGIKRKRFELDNRPKALEPGKGGGLATPAPVPAPAQAGAGAAGNPLAQRLAGEWKTGTAVTGAETLTFTADGTLTSDKAGAMRWVTSGPAQGETLTIKTAPQGQDPQVGEQRTIVFEDENQFSMTDSAGTRRFSRVGTAPAAPAEASSAAAAPDPVMSKMAGTWEDASGFNYTFRVDGTYTAAKGEKSTTGKWSVKSSSGNTVDVELVSPTGRVSPLQWDIGAAPDQIQRLQPKADSPFKRKS